MAEEEKFIIEDDSGDRNYFTIIPNFILNHSTSNDQSLYLQMKRFAGEKNECFASEVLLRKKLKIGRNALKKSIQYLIDHSWIKEKGFKEVPTKGGLQKIKVYSINNIWKMNNNFYKGCAETTGVSGITTLNEAKGCAETTSRVGQNDIKGWAGMTTNKNHREEEPYNKITAMQSIAGKEVNDLIELFKPINPSYEKFFKNTTQRKSVENLLKKIGFEKLTGAIKFLQISNKKEYAPIITTPLQLEDKFARLVGFANKEKLKNKTITTI